MNNAPDEIKVSAAGLGPALEQALANGAKSIAVLGLGMASYEKMPADDREPLQGAIVIHLTEQVREMGTFLKLFQDLDTLVLLSVGLRMTECQVIASLSQLTSLTLCYTRIGSEGAKALSKLKSLRSLDLHNNEIGDEGAKALSELKSLKSLNLDYNEIGSEGAKALSKLKSLKSLNLHNNKVGSEGAKALSELKSLTSLHLRSNEIGSEGAKALSKLKSLRSLDLHNNEIGDEGAKALSELKSLKSLSLRYNQLTDMSPFIGQIRAGLAIEARKNVGFGIGLSVQNCPMKHPPIEVIQEGREAVLNYFDEIEAQGSDQLYEAKVLLLGEGRAGKTSLLRRLYQSDRDLPEEDETTKGIEIHRHLFKMDGGRDFRLNVWDFGGQQIYHATHQFFLTKNSLYVLVDDTAKDHKSVHDDGFKYWLEVIENFSDCSPVLIFQNEKGGRSKTIDLAGIQGRFENVKERYAGNLQEPGATQALGEAIEHYAKLLPHIGETVPAKWVVIRDLLENRAKEVPYITQDEYFAIYAEVLDEDQSKALHLSQYLHNLGVFLHFQDERHLRRTIILQNRWATEAVFRMLDDPTVVQAFGRFTPADCDQVWQDSEYAEMHEELLLLMEKFELCYRLADATDEAWLAPQLLSPTTPSECEAWALPEDLVLSYRYEFLPQGLVSRLMVRMNRLVARPDLAWRSGVLFEREGSQALVREAARGNEIVFRARGPERKALLSVLASDLDALNDSFQGLRNKVTKWVPCHCAQCSESTSPEMYPEANLIERKANNKQTIECRKSYEDVSVMELLDGYRLEHLPKWSEEVSKPDEASDFQGPPQRIKIFLASSEELRADRDEFDRYFREQNDRLIDEGLYLEVVRWENFLDAMSETRKQDDYNEKVRDCDVFVSIFKTKTGKYTEEEFDVAHEAFKETGKPQIYTFFKDAQVSTDSLDIEALTSLQGFKDKLRTLKHFHSSYDGIESLKRQFKDQLEKLL